MQTTWVDQNSAVINRWLKFGIFNMIMANDKSSAMTDLEDLNRTLYDIGAQDLLDVWEAMESVSDFYIVFS